MFGLDPVRVALIVVGAVVVIGAIVVALRIVAARQSRGPSRPKAQFPGSSGGRIAVLESRNVDASRQLVLVRCDDVEHLIVIGGPADLVVENDVKKVRPQAPAARPTHPLQPAPAAQQTPAPLRVPPAMGASLDAAIAAAIPKSSETARPAPRPTAELRPPLQPRPPLAAVSPRPASRNSEVPAPSVAPRSDAPTRPVPQHAPADDFVRREPAPRRVAPQPPIAAPRQSAPPPPQATTDRFVRTPRNGREEPGLPTAQVPWAEPRSIEDEIVQALRLEPQRAAAPTLRREAAPAKPSVDSSTTLGDLADRLEEALAREIHATETGQRRAEPEASEVRADNEISESGESERERRPITRERQERRLRPEPARQSAPPPPEPVREAPAPQPERREEAPVISLNARRREAADPIEDEMARLLGELTGDTKGR
jgi:hypothetical protein